MRNRASGSARIGLVQKSTRIPRSERRRSSDDGGATSWGSWRSGDIAQLSIGPEGADHGDGGWWNLAEVLAGGGKLKGSIQQNNLCYLTGVVGMVCLPAPGAPASIRLEQRQLLIAGQVARFAVHHVVFQLALPPTAQTQELGGIGFVLRENKVLAAIGEIEPSGQERGRPRLRRREHAPALLDGSQVAVALGEPINRRKEGLHASPPRLLLDPGLQIVPPQIERIPKQQKEQLPADEPNHQRRPETTP